MSYIYNAEYKITYVYIANTICVYIYVYIRIYDIHLYNIQYVISNIVYNKECIVYIVCDIEYMIYTEYCTTYNVQSTI